VVLARAVKLSLVIPVYNEAPTLREIIQRVVAVDVDKELVLIDDGSTDGSRELLTELRDQGLSRFIGATHRVLYFWHMVVNRGLTLMSNMLNDLNLTDIEICYKAFTREVAKAIVIEENRFGVEPELTAKVAKMRLRIYEVPVSYRGRTYEEGKKIGWKDGVRAVYAIVKYGVRRPK
jgi:Glycosyl transferase family 2